MLNKTFTTILFLLFILLKSASANVRSNSVRIKGVITDIQLFTDSKMTFTVFKDYFVYAHSLGVPIAVPIKQDGSFDITMEAPSNFFYIRFSLDIKGRNTSIFRAKTGAMEAYLFESGDDIFMKINMKKTQLTCLGKGAEKINCQNQLYNTPYRPNGVYDREISLRSVDYIKGLEFQREIRKVVLVLQSLILNSYRNFMSDDVYNRIYQDLLGFSMYNQINGLQSHTVYADKDAYVAAKKFFYMHYPLPDTLVKKSKNINESAYYLDYLYEQERANLVFGNKIDSVVYTYTFKELYEIFKQKYTGDVRDKLLIMCYYRLGTSVQEEAKELLLDAMKVISNEKYRLLLDNWASKMTEPYQFTLPDQNGKYWTLNDFNGKILIIDFWFNGCVACATLKRKLEPVIKDYESRSDVSFVTVSIDQTKELWINGLEKGIYASPGQLNLFTEGLGATHPMVRHFGFTGVPQLVILGKNGRIISANKTDLMDNQAAGLRKILDQYH